MRRRINGLNLRQAHARGLVKMLNDLKKAGWVAWWDSRRGEEEFMLFFYMSLGDD